MKLKDITKGLKIKMIVGSPTSLIGNVNTDWDYDQVKDKDCVVAVWEWANRKLILTYNHTVNVFRLDTYNYNNDEDNRDYSHNLISLSDKEISRIINKGVIFDWEDDKLNIKPKIYNQKLYDKIKLSYVYEKL